MKFSVIRLLSVLLIFAVVGCSDDDDAGPTLTIEEVLPGSWELVSITTVTESVISGEVSGTSNFIAEGRDFMGSVTFTEDPNTYTSDWGYTYDMEFVVRLDSFPEQTANDVIVVPQEIMMGEWTINDDGQLVGLEIDDGVDSDETAPALDVEVVNDSRVNFMGNFNYLEEAQGIISTTEVEFMATMERIN